MEEIYDRALWDILGSISLILLLTFFFVLVHTRVVTIVLADARSDSGQEIGKLGWEKTALKRNSLWMRQHILNNQNSLGYFTCWGELLFWNPRFLALPKKSFSIFTFGLCPLLRSEAFFSFSKQDGVLNLQSSHLLVLLCRSAVRIGGRGRKRPFLSQLNTS